MTGFGRAQASTPLGKLTVEISGVNSRFLEVQVRLPRTLSALESPLREMITKSLARGKVIVTVNLSASSNAVSGTLVNAAVAKAYCNQLRKIQKQLKLAGDLTISDLALLPGVADSEQTEPDRAVAQKALTQTVQKALKPFKAMRAGEGKAMAADMKRSLKVIGTKVRKIEKRLPVAVKAHADRMKARIAELLAVSLNENARFEEEVALLAERSDINEECIRLKSHTEQFAEALGASGSTGRRLNFILQEMNREANTIGSKSIDAKITSGAIALKEEIEKLRELVQNVE